MELIKPIKKYENSWLEAVKEFRNDPRTINLWQISANPENLGDCDPDKPWGAGDVVAPPESADYKIFWLVDGSEFIGILTARHSLRDPFKKEGGHIGYEIRPSKRGMGYGKEMLRLGLVKAHECGLKKALIICDDDNLVSCKIIEKNGGVLEGRVQTPRGMVRRYWIDLAGN